MKPLAEGAGDSNHRDAPRLRQTSDADGRLVVHGLKVDLPLTCDHEVSSGETGFQTDGLQNDVDAGPEPSAEECDHATAQAAGCAGPGKFADVGADVGFDHLGKVTESRVELTDDLGRGAPSGVRTPPKLLRGR